MTAVSSRSLVANPAWATRIVASTYDLLEQQVKPALLPKLDDVRPARGGHVMADFTEYGCGAYGCVYPTGDPSVVMKLTEDSTEAEFAGTMSQDLTVPIVTRYFQVMKLKAKHKGFPVYLLWRESADEVGNIDKVVGGEVEEVIDRQHKIAQRAYHALRSKKKSAQSAIDGIHAWLEEWKDIAAGPVTELHYLASGILENWAAHRVFFGDIHPGNLGLCPRDGKPTWVITDPGNIAVLAH